MSTMGTFDAFTSARLGIYAAQHGLRVTGNNISNINTLGYTRQRLEQNSFKAGAYDVYRSQLDNHVGSGALVTGINQIRDPYLDVRYRNTNAATGYHETLLNRYTELADILDEVGKGEDSNTNEEGDGLLVAQLQTVSTALRAFAAEPTPANETIVRNAASTLCTLFNTYARDLEKLRQETEIKFNSQVTEINECLTNIRNLNKEIRDYEIFGDNALELRDERNRQIDKLSEYIGIKVVYSEEDVGAGKMVEKLSIYLADKNPDGTVHTDEALLVDGIFGTQFEVPESRPSMNPYYGSKDTALASIKDFLYQTDQPLEDPNKAGNFLYLVDDGNGNKVVQSFGPTDTIPTGAEAIMQGTNDPTKAEQVEGNDHYFLNLTKLLDEKGKEWEDITTTLEAISNQTIQDLITAGPPTNPGWEIDPDPDKQAQQATYSFEFTPSAEKWTDGQTFVIAGKTYTVTDGATTDHTKNVIDLDDANDPAEMLDFIAKVMNDKYTAQKPAFDVTVDGNKLMFTAQEAGKLNPGDIPKLTTIDDPDGKLTFAARVMEKVGRDATYLPPDDVTINDPVKGWDVTTTYEQINGDWRKVVITKKHTFETALDDNDLYGALQATRELLTEEGEFTKQSVVDTIDENASDRRGIPFYQKSLDLLARQFALQYNKLNQGYQLNQKGNYTNADHKELELVDLDTGKPASINKYEGPTAGQAQNLINNGYVLKDKDGKDVLDEKGNKVADLDRWLEENGAVKMGGLLFSNRGDRDSEGDGSPEDPFIDASNISIAQSWSNKSVQLVPKFEVLFGDEITDTTQNINADHMVTMMEQALIYNPRDLVPNAVSEQLFKGNFNAMFDDMSSTLGESQRAENIALTNSATTLVEIDMSRDGVSGVDLNDEAMNMMQFQKAMNAAMRLMTAVDEALDRLINNTGIAGR